MSILIQGLSMPDEGCHHTICVYADGKVETGGPNSYQAIQLPPHGRLIDADILPKFTGYALSADAIAEAVSTAPTVIPADKEADK